MTQTIIDKLERADGPDREIDAEIFIAVAWPDWRIQTECEPFHNEVRPGRIQEPNGFGWRSAPAYTASIDAAMTLVPKGVPVTLVMAGSGQAFIDSPDPCGGYVGACEYAATPALALCIASLRARSPGGE